ncbi:TPA: proton-conducting membrane transporter, partial [Candidatus Sumerlaeota bacterium]|nr:proton-conducting membrane transporter [Candidatus Sumerlaeota bacterium]
MACETCQTAEKEELEHIIAQCGDAPESALALLQAVQSRWRYLPPSALQYLCEKTKLSPAQVYGVATFYPHFRLRPAGEHTIRVCHGTACHVAGAEQVSETLRRKLHITDAHEDTSPDAKFTVERVACLGCCTMAPVMLIDETPYGRLDTAKTADALEHFIKEGGGKNNNREVTADLVQQPIAEIRIGLNSCCLASGGREVWNALRDAADAAGVPYSIKPVGCTGICHRAPIIEFIRPGQATTVLYGGSNPRNAIQMIRRELPARGLRRKLVRVLDRAAEFLANRGSEPDIKQNVLRSGTTTVSPFLDSQCRIVTENGGELDPLNIDDYITSGGYSALKKCVTGLSPEEVIKQVQESGLRGRGGAGFPSGIKWNIVRTAHGEKKYAICNGDEGDPGAFMDRMLLESFPHRILEGLIIAAYAAGADEAIFYVRTEYALALRRIRAAIAQAEERGFIGNNISGSNFSLKVRVSEGAGAFVCGEESALIASIEGQRGMPRFRPPYPAQKGLHDCPTLVNNVETLGNVPWILRNGAAAFAAVGTDRSKGTKVFALAGKVQRGGLIEVPMGTPLDKVVNEIGGGIKKGRKFKAVQLGGPS